MFGVNITSISFCWLSHGQSKSQYSYALKVELSWLFFFVFAAIKQTWWIVWWQLFAFLTPPPCSTFFLLKFQCQSLCGKVFFLLLFLLFFHSNCCKGCEKSSLTVSFCLFAACTWWEWEIFVEFSCGIFQRGFWGKSILHFTSHVRRLSCVCVCICVCTFFHERDEMTII